MGVQFSKDANSEILAAAATAAKLPKIIAATILAEELDVETALMLDSEDIAEMLSRKLDRKKMLSALIKLKAAMECNEGETKEDTSLPTTIPGGFKFHGFLTHTWNKDELGRPTHDRVTKVYDALADKGLDNWFGE